MKKAITLLFITVATLSFGQTYNLNTKGATVRFKYVSEETSGTLSDVDAKVTIDPSNLSAASVSGSVNVSTLSTENKMRDKHLLSDEFFDAEKFPTMKFSTGEVVKDGDSYKAKGKLVIKGISKDVTFTASEKDGVLLFKTTIFTDDFGFAVKKGRETSKVYVTVKIPLK